MLKMFRRNEKGQGMVEYGLILALISVVAISSLSGIGGKVKDIFDKVTGGAQGGEVTYTVTVEGGSGSGEYAVGDTVKVVAEVPEGQQFNSWNTEGIELDDNTQETLEFTMPENDVLLKTTTDDRMYTVTVEGGSGSGEYMPGDTVKVVAEVPEGQKLSPWVAEGIELDDNTQDTLEFTMPMNDVTLKITTYVVNKDFEWVSLSFGGSYEVTNEEGKGYYKYVGNEKEVKIPHEINGHPITNYFRMFYNSDVEKVISDNPNVRSMSEMFRSSSAKSLDLSSFDTSNVTIMSEMFRSSSATSLDLSSFDTSNVTNMRSMFYFSSAKSLDLTSFDTSKVTNMSSMFYWSSATSLDLSLFDTSKVTNMSSMFEDSSAKNLDLTSFDTSKVTNMSSMFRRSSATSLDLSSFDTSNVTNMGSASLRYDDDGSINGSTGSRGMFEGVKIDNLTVGDKFTFENVKTAKLLFNDATINNHNIDFGTANNLTSIEGAFYRSNLVGTIDISGWDINSINDDGLRSVLYETKIKDLKVKDSNTVNRLRNTKGVPSDINISVN